MLAWIDSLAPGDTVTFTRSDNSDSYAVYEVETLFTQLGGLEPYQGTFVETRNYYFYSIR